MAELHSLAAEVRKVGSPVLGFMRERFPHLDEVQRESQEQVAGLPTIRPDPSAGKPPYATIGAAIDYRLRYYFRKTIIQTMDAFRGATRLASQQGAVSPMVQVPMYGPKVAAYIKQDVTIPQATADFFESLDAFVNRVDPVRRMLKPADELCLSRYCYVLALLEQAARGTEFRNSGAEAALRVLKRPASMEELLALPEEAWVKDIGRMSWLFGKRHSRLFYAKVRVNPTYRMRAAGFGADADLLVDGAIIDIKTVLEPVLEPTWLYQVLGYALLDQSNEWGIRGVGFYLARQGALVQWELEPLIERLSGSRDVSLDALRSEFWKLVADHRRW